MTGFGVLGFWDWFMEGDCRVTPYTGFLAMTIMMAGGFVGARRLSTQLSIEH
jgi:hypothetical protein